MSTQSKVQRGQILPVFCLLPALLLLPVTGLVVDGGVLLSTHANVAAAAQSAAEAAAQAVDVTAIQRDDTFELCADPDGGANCGNGIGTVGQVVAAVIRGSYPGAPSECANTDGSTKQPPALNGSGCSYALESSCSPGPVTGVDSGSLPDGVTVRAWHAIELPLLVFPGWSSVSVTSSATAWMQHGFATQSIASNQGVQAC